ncbi:glycosyltransferase [Pseudomonas citronellolis]|uniref:glycosyltransferase n=1 Tax=Pseudomonas citronellolis TaxID=53408 RepID=UPI000B18A3F6|nr:glycosyltransferase [Pseudomonas humi]
MKIDVSVVLNIHREALYLRPTLYSLDTCATEAVQHGIIVELVAVFDRSDAATRAVFQSTPLTGFAAIKSVEIDVGSLGLARNAGVELAEGEFVWTADADDLVSRNALIQLVRTARNHPHKNVAIFIEYLAAFGEQYHVVRYVGSEWLTAADFAYQHPYVSRIFLRASIFKELQYLDLKVTTGFAYEDWDFNCRLFSSGTTFLIAPDTVFFYRQRNNSLLRQANAVSARLIPHSTLFEPSFFRTLMTNSRKEHPDWNGFLAGRRRFHERDLAKELLDSAGMTDYIAEAAALDPEVEPYRIESAPSYYPIPWDGQHWGFRLERLYELLGSHSFTDVVLLPWLRPGGAEKYILQILGKLQAQGLSKRILILTGQSASKHEWTYLLPKGSVFIDLFNTFPSLSDMDRNTLAVRAILATANEGARLHLKSSKFSHQIMDSFSPALSDHLKIVYYRFSDGIYDWEQHRIHGPWGIKFLRQHFSFIDKVVSDCYSIVEKDAAALGQNDQKYNVIYTNCKISKKHKKNTTAPCMRLLWASRIATEKRPELIRLVASRLSQEIPNISIDAYGTIDPGYDSKIFDAPGLTWRGEFSNFFDLPIDQYDAFIYTSKFDGLPNIILEAMGAGLLVIAPDVGGIAEAVIDGDTGYLIPDLIDDTALVEAYVQAVKQMYARWEHTSSMRERARGLIQERHGEHAFSERVAQTFGVTTVQEKP